MLNLVDRLIVLDQGQVVADGPRAIVLDALASGRGGKPEKVDPAQALSQPTSKRTAESKPAGTRKSA